jgi:hypothetical protein
MNGRIEKISEPRSHGEVGQRRKDHGHHGFQYALEFERAPSRALRPPTRTEWIATILLPN